MTAAISVCPCPPVRDFEHEHLTKLVRREPLALLTSRHIGMQCIESRMVANTVQLPVNFRHEGICIKKDRNFHLQNISGFYCLVPPVG
eukprot:1160210-Pelagomonas_calceolata.AAC.5